MGANGAGDVSAQGELGRPKDQKDSKDMKDLKDSAALSIRSFMSFGTFWSFHLSRFTAGSSRFKASSTSAKLMAAQNP
jgi:hypothetical protein